MAKKLFNFNLPIDLIKKVDKTISESNSTYKDRTHFITLAIQEKLECSKQNKQ